MYALPYGFAVLDVGSLFAICNAFFVVIIVVLAHQVGSIEIDCKDTSPKNCSFHGMFSQLLLNNKLPFHQ